MNKLQITQDLLAENNVCGQTLLQIVSRGNAIIAEILRLRNYIPIVFKLGKQDQQKYGDLIFDFSYFKSADNNESKIQSNYVLRELDEEFKCNNLEIIKRFYSAFESIHTYVTDLNHYIQELEDGYYIHQSVENVFLDMEGRQLLCEALYLYGVMLLTVDAHIEGTIRERLLVSHYRYTPQRQDTESKIDDVCKLLRDTSLGGRKPNNYPEDYFKRVPLKDSFIDMVIGKLRSDDIYNQVSVYPLPKHRSTALATQGAMLYICLFFNSSILHSQTAVMREIVDKYFPDNWVVSIYMGLVANLIESWEYFKAAKLALNNTLEIINIKSYSATHGNSIKELTKITTKYLKSGVITKENLLEKITALIGVIRDCNVVIRWIMLHQSCDQIRTEKVKRTKQMRDLVLAESKYDAVELFKLLLNTAQLELIVRDLFKSLLQEKEDSWNKLKEESSANLEEISDVFSGNKPLVRIQKNVTLQRWFLEISKQVQSLSQTEDNSSVKLVQLIQALEEVQEYHDLGTQMQIVQCLKQVRKNLDQMIHNIKINDDVLITLQIIADVSYAWEIIDSYTGIMQTGIKSEPKLVIKLRAVFLKLASAMETPLLRINQAHSEDFVSVSQYYSNELEIYIRMVLQIIPKMMFEKMARIIELQTSVLKEMPTRIERNEIKEYAQMDERFEFAQLTHSISVFTQGMRMMKTTLVGVVCLDPKKLLEDGIRKELVIHISKALHNELVFNGKGKSDDLEIKLKALSVIMDGYKRSFEYIQDYVCINGLKIWQEEITRIINYNVEQECNGFLKNKVHEWESAYQSRFVPIPNYPSVDRQNANFIGRLAREILRITDPKSTFFIEQIFTWHDAKTQKILANKRTVALLMTAIEVTGLVGLDRLFSFMIVNNLKSIIEILENKNNRNPNWNSIISSVLAELAAVDEEVPNLIKVYQNLCGKAAKCLNVILEFVLNVGQLQILKNGIAFQLNTTCKFDAKNLESSLSSLNKSLLMDFTKNSEVDNLPNEELMERLSVYFDYAGLNNPFNKIYIMEKSQQLNYAHVLFLFTISHLSKMFFYRSSSISNRKTFEIDGYVFVLGMHTLLKQLHSNINKNYVRQICDYVQKLSQNFIATKNEVCVEALTALKYLDSLSTFSQLSKECFEANVPPEFVYLYESAAQAK